MATHAEVKQSSRIEIPSPTATPPIKYGAQGINPGLWEIVMKTTSFNKPGWKSAPFSLRKCITVSDAASPERVISMLATSGTTNCSFSQITNANGVFTFASTCKGSYGLKTTGSLRYTPQLMEGTIQSVGNVGNQQTTFDSQISARHMGECR